MADKPKASNVSRESLVAQQAARDVKADVTSAVRETLRGSDIGRNVAADVTSVSIEVISGLRYGIDVKAEILSAGIEVLSSDQAARDIKGDVAVVVREVLIKEPPFRFGNVIRESLVSMTNERLTVTHIIPSYRQQVVVPRPPMEPPSTVKSMESVYSLRSITVQQNHRVQPRSGEWAQTLRMQALLRRQVTAAPAIRSPIIASTLRVQVLISRGQAYIPESAAYAAGYRQQILQHRVVTAAPAIRSPIRVGRLVETTLQSRRVIVAITDVFAAKLSEVVLLKDTRPAPISVMSAKSFVSIALQRRNVTPPGIDDRVASFVQVVVVPHMPAARIGMEHVAKLTGVTIIKRPVAVYRSPEQIAKFAQQSLQRAFYPAPGYLLGWRVHGMQQQIVVKRPRSPIIGTAYVSSLRTAFILRRVTLPPIEVIDPAVGRHVASLHALSLHHRVTLPPEQKSKSLFAYAVIEQIALGDKFPPPEYPPKDGEVIVNTVAEIVVHHDSEPWAPVSVVRANAVIEQVAIGDAVGWEDPTIPHSDIRANAVIEQVAIGDKFINPAVPQSAAEVMAMIEQVASGDKFVDPLIPQSSVQVEQVVEVVASGDKFADPLIPISVAQVLGLAEAVAFHDDDLTGKFTMSTITVNVVAQVIVLPDKTMKGIPLRHGPRPVVSITIS